MASTDPSASAVPGTVARLVAAAAVLVSGLVHLQLYFDGYRNAGDANFGRSFLLNAVASVVLAVALLFRREVLVRLAAAGLLAGTLVAFALSRSDVEVFGFTETGLNPSPQAAIALVAEIVGLLALAATFVPRIGAGRELRPVGRRSRSAPPWSCSPWPAPRCGRDRTAPSRSRRATSGAVIGDHRRLRRSSMSPLEVPAGTTVEWINDDAFAAQHRGRGRQLPEPRHRHAVSASRFTFTEPGTYDYLCGIHPTMRGTIVVT